MRYFFTFLKGFNPQLNLYHKRWNHIDIHTQNLIKNLLENHNEPIKTFIEPIKYSIKNIDKLENRAIWTNGQYAEYGGIYIVQYNLDPRIYYIGKTINLGIRLTDHIRDNRQMTKFHTFAKAVGWDKFTFSIIYLFPKSKIRQSELNRLEHQLLNKYMPILNTQIPSNEINKNSIEDQSDNLWESWEYKTYYVYNVFIDDNLKSIISPRFKIYRGLNALCSGTKLYRETVLNYLNTYFTIKRKLIFTAQIRDMAKLANQVQINVSNQTPVYIRTHIVIVYYLDDQSNIITEDFQSRLAAAKSTGIHANILNKLNDKNIIKHQNVFYSNMELTRDQYSDLQNYYAGIQSKGPLSDPIFKYEPITKYWIYSSSLELIGGPFDSVYKFLKFFKLPARNLDSFIDTHNIIKTKLYPFEYLIFTKELTPEMKSLIKPKNSVKSRIGIDIYKLINNNEFKWLGSYPSINSVHKSLGLSSSSINKYIDTNIPFKNYLIFKAKDLIDHKNIFIN